MRKFLHIMARFPHFLLLGDAGFKPNQQRRNTLYTIP